MFCKITKNCYKHYSRRTINRPYSRLLQRHNGYTAFAFSVSTEPKLFDVGVMPKVIV